MRVRRRPLLILRPAARPPRIHRHGTPPNLRNRVRHNMSRPDRPPVELVHRGHFSIPRRTRHSRPQRIPAPPPQVSQMISFGSVPPTLLIPGEPEERQERREVPRMRLPGLPDRTDHRRLQEVAVQHHVELVRRRDQERSPNRQTLPRDPALPIRRQTPRDTLAGIHATPATLPTSRRWTPQPV